MRYTDIGDEDEADIRLNSSSRKESIKAGRPQIIAEISRWVSSFKEGPSCGKGRKNLERN